jgi:hypothetical protein
MFKVCLKIHNYPIIWYGGSTCQIKLDPTVPSLPLRFPHPTTTLSVTAPWERRKASSSMSAPVLGSRAYIDNPWVAGDHHACEVPWRRRGQRRRRWWGRTPMTSPSTPAPRPCPCWRALARAPLRARGTQQQRLQLPLIVRLRGRIETIAPDKVLGCDAAPHDLLLGSLNSSTMLLSAVTPLGGRSRRSGTRPERNGDCCVVVRTEQWKG